MPFIHLLIFLVRLLSGADKKKRAPTARERREEEARREVRVLDPATNEVTRVQQRDLTPGMTQVMLPGAGLVRVKPGCFQQGDVRHQPFPAAALEVVKGIKEALDEVFPQSLQKWEEDLRRVARPEVEVARWLRVADAYKSCTEGIWLTPEAKRDYYKVVCACSLVPRGQVLDEVRLLLISRAEARQAMAVYYGDRR